MKNLILLIWFVLPELAQAHVKWFSNYRYDQQPIQFSQLNNFTFWSLLALSAVTIGVLVVLNTGLRHWSPYRRLNDWLASYGTQAPLIIRIFTGASHLLAWQGDAMIAPELKIVSPWTGAFQYAIALLLLFRTTTPIAGVGMIIVYFIAVSQYGFFHLLDYLAYLAVGYYLIVAYTQNKKLRETGIPALYLGLGLTLCWVALEKFFYPGWGLQVLQQARPLAMGLELNFFLMGSAFVEFCLGYLLIICVLERPLALTITLVFFTTTSFFGKTELVGHNLIHGILIVLILAGPGGYFTPPIAIHRRLSTRIAFAVVNFLILFALLALPYHYLSERAYQKALTKPPAEQDH
jgi:hypothetical protein